MKRIVAITTVVTIISLILATFVFAADNTNVPQWSIDMMSSRKAQIELAEKNGEITKEQAELYKSHIDQMLKFHTENGFPNGMGFGACGGGTYNNGSNSSNSGNRFGHGMMGIY